jgi:hypothetical protein
VTLIERNDARPGKPAYWVKDRIGTVAHADLERLIPTLRRPRAMRACATWRQKKLLKSRKGHELLETT